MQPNILKRNINGVLLLDKPTGISSNGALQEIKKCYEAKKAGHTGTLDPLACGLLPICFGEATKFAHDMLNADKCYQAVIRLGKTTTTGDAEGAVVRESVVRVNQSDIERALSCYRGRFEQIPPMYSALKYNGKPLYLYARAGEIFSRESRAVTIYELKLDWFGEDEIGITVSCSKGTYIRTLAQDIGNQLGCGAYLSKLTRTGVSHFDLQSSFTMEWLKSVSQLERESVLLPIDVLVHSLPCHALNQSETFLFRRGQAVTINSFNSKLRVYGGQGEFLGLGEATAEGKLIPKRLIANSPLSH